MRAAAAPSPPAGSSARRRGSSLQAAERRLAWLLLLPAFVAVAALVAWPLYVIVQMSLRPGRALAPSQLMSQPLGLANYERVLNLPALWAAYGHSAVYTIACTQS